MGGDMSGACLGHHLRHVWGMSGASSEACLGHHLGYIWGFVWGMSVACLGQSKISAVLHASLMPFFFILKALFHKFI